MINISELDKNLAVSHTLDKEVKERFEFFDPEQAPFKMYGVFRENEKFVRIPTKVAETVSDGVNALKNHSAGGRIRFVTDSKSVALIVKCWDNGGMAHFAYAGVCGFDLYGSQNDDMRYFGTFVSPLGFKGGYEGVVNLPSKEKRTICINMPLYNCVEKVYIGLMKGSVLEEAEDLIGPPVVYYGSSITQGGCASKPGDCYQAILHRNLKTDYINLGFSGNAKGEDTMMEYIAGLDMSVFVYDYDHNAPSVEHLKNTHYKGYKKVREAHSDMPIIMMTRPKFYITEDELARNATVRATYEKAVAEGDEKVYFIDGRELVPEEVYHHALVDNCHPTDLGFFYMAKRIAPLLYRFVK